MLVQAKLTTQQFRYSQIRKKIMKLVFIGQIFRIQQSYTLSLQKNGRILL